MAKEPADRANDAAERADGQAKAAIRWADNLFAADEILVHRATGRGRIWAGAATEHRRRGLNEVRPTSG
jgi:hypothetical protein